MGLPVLFPGVQYFRITCFVDINHFQNKLRMVLVILMADPALPGCNETWDRFDVLKVAISCGTCLSKIVS